MGSNYQADIKSDINTLAWWVFTTKFQGYKGDCPKVGCLGYANGMSNAEWLAVSLAQDILFKRGKDWKDYFDYRVDSSG